MSKNSCRDEHYDPDKIPLPDNFDAVPGEDQPALQKSLSRPSGAETRLAGTFAIGSNMKI